MPTGYTSEIYDGKKKVTLERFAKACAHAFLGNLRDRSMESEIPDELESSDYHQKALAKAKNDLAKLNKISMAEAEKKFKASKAAIARAKKSTLMYQKDLFFRYESMITKVERWEAPKDLANLKKFMLEQLRTSIEADCYQVTKMPEPQDDDDDSPVNAKEWLQEKKDSARHDIEYHSEHIAKEAKHAREYAAWVRALKSSIK